MEENARNPNSYQGGEDEENKQSNNASLNTAEQFFQGLFRSSNSMNRSGEQNLPAINQPAAETEPMRQQHSGQRQPADISSVDSHSRRNNAEITAADRLARKREHDKAYRDRIKENQKRMKFDLEAVQAENESLKRDKETLLKELDKLKKYKKRHNLTTVEDENEPLRKENVSVNKKFESQIREIDELKKYKKHQENEQQMKFNTQKLEIENDKLKKKYKKQRERKRQLKSDLKTLEAEKERLKDQIIESLKVDNVLVNRMSETQSKELGDLRSKLENLEKELPSTRTCGNSQSIARSGTSLIHFGQYCPSGETEGSMQSSQATMLPPSSAFPSDASSPAVGSLSNQSLRTFGEGKARGRIEIQDCEGDPCSCNELKQGPWSMEEDEKLISYIVNSGHGNWREVPKFAGLSRCGKCCRIRWMNSIIKPWKP